MMRCTHWRRVPLDLARKARERSVGEGVDRAVQCQLSTHNSDEHYGLLGDFGEYGTALWLRWRVRTEVGLVVLPDCLVVTPGPDGEGCCLFAGHIEQHTWEDPLSMQTRRPRPPRSESCGDCGGSGANSSGKTCGTCDGLGELHCRVDRQSAHVPSRSMSWKEGH